MNYSLKTVIVDDSPFDSTILKDLLRNSGHAHVTHVFNDPKEFMEKAPDLEMDLCLLDITMPEMDGLLIAQLLKGKPIIFVTGMREHLEAAISLNPIDIVLKPIWKDRLDLAIEKAYKLLHCSKEYGLFCVAECKRKVKIHLSDIILVTTDETDARHKIVWLKHGIKYTLMDCSFEYLQGITPNLIQVNKAELVSMEAVREVEHDLITVNFSDDMQVTPKEITLSRAFRENFHKKLFFKH